MFITCGHQNDVVTLDSYTTKKNRRYVKKIEYALGTLYQEALYVLTTDVDSRYQTIFLPKRKGGKRRIDVPDEELKKFQRKVVDFFLRANLLFPANVHSYVKSRSNKTLGERHTEDDVLMHFDLKDFFHNCTMKLIMDAMLETYPFALMPPEILQVVLGSCMLFYDGDYRLPQGAPSSPFWSNVAMIPFDAIMDRQLMYGPYHYSRYADDIFVSYQYQKLGRYTNNEGVRRKIFIPKRVNEIVSNYGLVLNETKTYVAYPQKSAALMLGVTISADGVKIGHHNKQLLKAGLWEFLADMRDGKRWDLQRRSQLMGKLAYARFIEPDYVDNLIKKYEKKSGMELNGWM